MDAVNAAQRMSSWPIDSDAVDDLVRAIRPLRVAVIGDFCLDVYLTLAAAAEPSVETGLPTRPVAEQRYSLGGAGNVAANLAALGCAEVRAYGVIGEDPFGAELARILRRAGIDADGLLTQDAAWDTCAYAKLLEIDGAGYRESDRIDYGAFNRLRPETADRLAAQLAGALAAGRLDAVVINQQVRCGVHAKPLRHRLQDLIRRHPETLWVTDSRDFAEDFAGTVLKCNEAEAAAAAGIDPAAGGPLRPADAAAAELFRRSAKPVFVTRGDRGCLACDSAGVIELPALAFRTDLDPVGAGDAFLAGLAAALAAGRAPAPAAAFAGLAAGVTVTKLHRTGTASSREVCRLARAAIYRFRPELAAAADRARYVPGSAVEIVCAPPPRPGRHYLFDHDGTVAALRRGERTARELMIGEVRGFLEALCERGTRRYLAGGADEAEVRAEAERIGYAHLFDEIAGARGGRRPEPKRPEPKRQVLQDLFARLGRGITGELVAFGHGPVEIRETVRAGGYAVGVAGGMAGSERRRFAADPARRTRLIEAGAGLVVPDFSQGEILLRTLGLPTSRERVVRVAERAVRRGMLRRSSVRDMIGEGHGCR